MKIHEHHRFFLPFVSIWTATKGRKGCAGFLGGIMGCYDGVACVMMWWHVLGRGGMCYDVVAVAARRQTLSPARN